jgi:endonuclease YncB( thermonuclease family)
MRFLLFLLVLAAAPALARPDCAGPMAASVRVQRIGTDGVLVLADGRAARLEGIRLPQGARDQAPATFARQALAALDGMAKGHLLTLTAVAPSTDRYDRIRVQAFEADGTWLQVALLRRGLARGEIAPDRSDCAAELYAAEAEARTQHLGLWSSPAYAVRDATAMNAPAGTFQILEGKVLHVGMNDGRVFLDFGEDYRRDFTAIIAPDDRKTFRAMGIDPRDYRGKRIRLRGTVQIYKGPEIEIANPAQIELLQ